MGLFVMTVKIDENFILTPLFVLPYQILAYLLEHLFKEDWLFSPSRHILFSLTSSWIIEGLIWVTGGCILGVIIEKLKHFFTHD